MARLARVIAPGMPHHVTQRGNSRQETFFGFDGGLEGFVLALPPLSAHAEEAAQSAGPAGAVLASSSRRRFHGGFHACLLLLIGGDHSPIAGAQQNR